MNAAYEQGFIDKCAELGVDPMAVAKLASYGGAPVPSTGSSWLLKLLKNPKMLAALLGSGAVAGTAGYLASNRDK